MLIEGNTAQLLRPELVTRPEGSDVAGAPDAQEGPRSERRHRRLPGELDVLFKKQGSSETQKGRADNISAGGMRLRLDSHTTAVFPVETRLEIRVDDPVNGFVVEGEVVHSNGSELGIRFLPPTELVAPLLIPRTEERNETQSWAAELGMYKLTYGSPEEFNALHDSVLKIGGMIISTPLPAALGTEIQVEVALAYAPDAKPVRLAARVVRAFLGEMAVMGVEITNLQSSVPELQQLRAVSDSIAGSSS